MYYVYYNIIASYSSLTCPFYIFLIFLCSYDIYIYILGVKAGRPYGHVYVPNSIVVFCVISLHEYYVYYSIIASYSLLTCPINIFLMFLCSYDIYLSGVNAGRLYGHVYVPYSIVVFCVIS